MRCIHKIANLHKLQKVRTVIKMALYSVVSVSNYFHFNMSTCQIKENSNNNKKETNSNSVIQCIHTCMYKNILKTFNFMHIY